MISPVHIAGDVLEGGGQILRLAISLSALTRKPVLIDKIRAGRKKGGLAAQHLNGVQLVQQLCSATVEGAALGSMELHFRPKSLKSGNFTADARTAGDGPTKLTLKGGTNAEMAPQIEYTTRAFLPMLRKFGACVDFQIMKRGFFPAGKGVVLFEIPAVRKLQSVQLTDFGYVEEITGEAFFAGNTSQMVAEQMARAAKNAIVGSVNMAVGVDVVRLGSDEAFGTGWGINLIAKTSTGCLLGASQIGHRGANPEDLGRMAGLELATAIKQRICVDQHMQDQLAILMALAEGTSSMLTGPITLHTETAIHAIQLLTNAKFRVTEQKSGYIIECNGIGLINANLA